MKKLSKKAAAKVAQDYMTENPARCGACRHLHKRTELVKGLSGTHRVDKELRCLLGGFAVKKLAVCKMWEAKPQ